MKRTNIESAAYLMLEAYKNTRQMADALTLVASQNECTGVPYDVLQGMWLVLDAYHDLNEIHRYYF
jgi:hypothetical protein